MHFIDFMCILSSKNFFFLMLKYTFDSLKQSYKPKGLFLWPKKKSRCIKIILGLWEKLQGSKEE